MSSVKQALFRTIRAAWKVVLLAAIAAGVVYYLRFRPVPVKAFTVKSDTVQSEVMGTQKMIVCVSLVVVRATTSGMIFGTFF